MKPEYFNGSDTQWHVFAQAYADPEVYSFDSRGQCFRNTINLLTRFERISHPLENLAVNLLWMEPPTLITPNESMLRIEELPHHWPLLWKYHVFLTDETKKVIDISADIKLLGTPFDWYIRQLCSRVFRKDKLFVDMIPADIFLENVSKEPLEALLSNVVPLSVNDI